MNESTQDPLTHLDEAICKLESMGTILTLLATTEAEEPEMTSLADLGRIIQSLAMEALEIVSDMEFASRTDNKEDGTSKKPKSEGQQE